MLKRTQTQLNTHQRETPRGRWEVKEDGEGEGQPRSDSGAGIPKSALDFVTSEPKIADEKMESKPSFRCTLLLLRKWNRIPSADCQICPLSSFYPMTSMRGGPPLPPSPVRDPLLQSAFTLGLSFHHTFRALRKVGKTSSPSPLRLSSAFICRSLHLSAGPSVHSS